MQLPCNYRPKEAGQTKEGTDMSKSKYGNSNLYMTTREFADMVIDALDEQNYFKKDDVAHPYDIAMAFTTVGETIGKAMEWAISQEAQMKLNHNISYTTTSTGNDTQYTVTNKNAVMETKDLRKSALPIDDEIAPAIDDNEVGYSEWRSKKGYM